MKKVTVFDCSILELPRHTNRAGNISIAENNINLPFEVKRVFYIYDIPGGEDRGAHAHKECHQFLIAASGSFEIEMSDFSDPYLINREPAAMPPFHQQGVEIHAKKATLKVNGETINIIIPPVGISGGPASVVSPNGVYAR